ncbi:MAG: hypothetical protein Q4P20_12055 [Eubacteriales bacterium]|nr:hypothetical protein [Eubacteriales bacterium]
MNVNNAVQNLPHTKIETDSYVAVQLLERERKLDFSSIRKMAETVEGNFTFIILDRKNNLYIVKGTNPMCIAHFKEAGFYLYASTQDILCRAIAKLDLEELDFDFVPMDDGEILCIRANGTMQHAKFDICNQWDYLSAYSQYYYGYGRDSRSECETYIDQLLIEAERNGIDSSIIRMLLDAGYSWIDVEELIYTPTLLDECLDELLVSV